MTKDVRDLLETPDTCEETTEYDNTIEENDAEEVETEEEEDAATESPRTNWEEFDQDFSRFERNYRARRIRELMNTPLKKRGGNKGRTPKTIAA